MLKTKRLNKLLFVITFFFLVGAIFFFSFRKGMWVIFVSPHYAPTIQLDIQGKPFSVLVDLGSAQKVYLDELVLSNIQKTKTSKISQTVDYNGKIYHSPTYRVPEVLGHEYEVSQENLQFLENTILMPSDVGNPKKYNGRVGWNFFQNRYLLIDFPNSIICASDSNSLKRKLKNFIPVLFSVEKGVLVINIETDSGIQRVLLDTGASFSILENKNIESQSIKILPNGLAYCKTKKFQIGDVDFGSWNFLLQDVVNVNGVIGVDFFLEHAMLFDFDNKVVYIEKPKGLFETQWKRLKFYIIQFFVSRFV